MARYKFYIVLYCSVRTNRRNTVFFGVFTEEL